MPALNYCIAGAAGATGAVGSKGAVGPAGTKGNARYYSAVVCLFTNLSMYNFCMLMLKYAFKHIDSFLDLKQPT